MVTGTPLHNYKDGDYVQTFLDGKLVVGIVYEPGYSQIKFQLPDGTKVRYFFYKSVSPATPEQIAEFQAAAVPGLTPAEIIAREQAERDNNYGMPKFHIDTIDAKDAETDDEDEDDEDEDE